MPRIEEIKKRYHVEVGTVSTDVPVTAVEPVIDWHFMERYDSQREAQAEARRIARLEEHVRIVDTESPDA